MNLHDALETIGAAYGMLRFFMREFEQGGFEEKFLFTQVNICIETVYDETTNSFGNECRSYFAYVESGKENKMYIVDIRPVCNYLINEWPSPKTLKIRKYLEKVHEKCVGMWMDTLIEDLVYYAVDVDYIYDRRYTQRQLQRTIKTVILDTIIEMECALRLTKKANLTEKTSKMRGKYKKSRRIKSFREFVKDAERTDEIIEKLHRLIGNKTNSNALRIIARAWWIEWLDDRPTATSIKEEFPTITCSDQHISNCLSEVQPSKNGKVDEEAIEGIRREYEAV